MMPVSISAMRTLLADTGRLSPAELFARAETVAFYGAVLAFLVSRFTPNGTSFSLVLSICAAVELRVIILETKREYLYTEGSLDRDTGIIDYPAYRALLSEKHRHAGCPGQTGPLSDD